MRYLVTGGAGFIGSNFIRYLFDKYGDGVEVVNVDKLTYAGNLDNLKDISDRPNYRFIKGDICDAKLVDSAMAGVNRVVNFAAESHVDRSIGAPDDFIKTEIYGAFVLLEAARRFGVERFVQISTDEVYGSILRGSFRETDILEPSSPYSASKAGADRLAYSYFKTYDLPVIVTRCSNNYGPYQYPEKLIPLFVTHAIENKSLPIYGDGKNVRDLDLRSRSLRCHRFFANPRADRTGLQHRRRQRKDQSGDHRLYSAGIGQTGESQDVHHRPSRSRSPLFCRYGKNSLARLAAPVLF